VSEELNKHKSFEVVLISAAAQEGSELTTNKETRYIFLTYISYFCQV